MDGRRGVGERRQVFDLVEDGVVGRLERRTEGEHERDDGMHTTSAG